MQYRVVNVTEDVTVLDTEDEKLATDYHAQCVRGSERFHARCPDTPFIQYELRRVDCNS